MATFTMYLHEVLDTQSPDHADPSIIGLDTYPIWDEGYRDELNHKIIMRYWNREIGFETPLMFTHHVKRLMGEIMPYYNQLAKTTLWDFDPLITVDVENTSTSDMEQLADTTSKDTTTADTTSQDTTTADTEETGVEDSESTSNQKSGNESESVASEHPQTQLQGNEDYATASNRSQSVSESESDTTGRGESQRTSNTTGEAQHTSTTTGDGETETRGTTRNTASSADRQTGFTGSRSQLLQEYRDTIIGVDNQILAELEVLFMGVWDTDEAYTRLQPSWFDPYPTIF